MNSSALFSSNEDLREVAKRLRRRIVTMIGKAGSGHPGGSLSAIDILVALYWRVLRHRPADPLWPDRDRFILSKGHAVPALYAVLAECGYFPLEELDTLRQLGSRLQGHGDCCATPGVEMSSGSLGQGLSFGIGAALAGRLDAKDYRVYVMVSDGECDEGQTWEAAMAAAHFKLDNLTVIVDRNGLQLSGFTKDIMGLGAAAGQVGGLRLARQRGRRARYRQSPGRHQQSEKGEGAAGRHHRPHDQGQRRQLHGEQRRFSRQGPERRAAGAGLEGAGLMAEEVSLRETYGKTLVELGKENRDIVVLDADLAPSTMTKYFAAAFPERFFEVGIAEQNMIGIAAGPGRLG